MSSSNGQLVPVGNSAMNIPHPTPRPITFRRFPQFRALPLEVKQMIWAEHIKSRRQFVTLKGKLSDTYQGHRRRGRRTWHGVGGFVYCDEEVTIDIVGYKYPSLLLVDKATREYALKWYTPVHINPFSAAPLFLELDLDVVHVQDVNTFKLLQGPLGHGPSSTCPCAKVARVETLAEFKFKIKTVAYFHRYMDLQQPLIDSTALELFITHYHTFHHNGVDLCKTHVAQWRALWEQAGRSDDIRVRVFDRIGFKNLFSHPRKVSKKNGVEFTKDQVKNRERLLENNLMEKNKWFSQNDRSTFL